MSIYKKAFLLFLICFISAVFAQQSIGSGYVGEEISFDAKYESSKKIERVKLDEPVSGFVVYFDSNSKAQVKEFYSNDEISFYPYAKSIIKVCKNTLITWNASKEAKSSFWGLGGTTVCFKFALRNNEDQKGVTGHILFMFEGGKTEPARVDFRGENSDNQTLEYAHEKYKNADVVIFMVTR